MRPSLLSLVHTPLIANSCMTGPFGPRFFQFLFSTRFFNMSKILIFVENNGFEPLTLCVQGRCSSQLS